MIETNKKISSEQIDILKQFSNEKEIEMFFSKLNFNYGDGEVLNFNQIESFFMAGMHKMNEKDALSYFVDTIRMLRLLNEDEDGIIGLDFENIFNLHNQLVSTYQGSIDEIKKSEYVKSVSPFINLNGVYRNIRIELISTLDELNEEGSSMNHCIASYHDIIINKQYVGFRVFNLESEERLTLGCHRNGNNLFFNQLKGNSNYPAEKDSCLTVLDFCKEKGIKILESEFHDLLPAFQS